MERLFMERQEISDWIDWCEGRKHFERQHFSRIFMELYIEPLTVQDKDDLRTIFKYIPNSSGVLQKMLRIGVRGEDKTNEQIIEIVKKDLHEKRKIIDQWTQEENNQEYLFAMQQVLKAIDASVIKITIDEDYFLNVSNGNANSQFYHPLACLLMPIIPKCDEKTRAIINAFDGISPITQLQDALTVDLLGLDVNFDNYFELFLLGVDYALRNSEEFVVINHRAAMDAEQ